MKTILLIFTSFSVALGFSQISKENIQALKVEWQRELISGYPDVSGLVLTDDKIYVTQTGDQTGSAFSILSTNGNLLFNSSTYARIRSFFACAQSLYSMGDERLTKRDLGGNIVEEHMLPFSESGYISAMAGKILSGRAYAIDIHNYFFKFSLNGEQLFKKEIGTLTDNHFLDVGGNFIYIYSSITKPALGSRLMQYDTLGNQKWSVGIGRLVYGMYADDAGYCYMLTSETEGIGHVEKYDTDGNLVYDVKLPGQRGTNAYRLGDSLFICGQVSAAVRVGGQKMAALCILSVKTGEVYYQQTLDLDPDPIHQEDFTQIVSDGQNIYVGGYYGGQTRTCVLLKYSREGSTTGIQEQETSNSFSVFPNPSGSNFTISSSKSISNVHITMRNAAGQLVFSKNITKESGKNVEVSPGELPAGTYFVEIVSGAKKTVKKIVVE